jgi:hypothetical protein
MCDFSASCGDPGVQVNKPVANVAAALARATGQPVPGGPAPTQQKLCRRHYGEVWKANLISEHGKQLRVVPFESLQADQYYISLVAIRNDSNYLNKSFVYTMYSPAATASPLRALRNPVTKKIISAATGMSIQEINRAKRTTPKDSDSNPTMGHTYIVMHARRRGSTVALYTFGYFPLADGVMNPDSHLRLRQEQRRSVDYLVDGTGWRAAMETIVDWRFGHVSGAQTYALMGHNCTAFARDVIRSAGKKFLGDSIPTLGSQGLGKAWTPNRTFSALKSKKRHQQWETGSDSDLSLTAVHINVANASELHQVFFDDQ